jgi:transcriptional regulator with XRE-family HTH domain
MLEARLPVNRFGETRQALRVAASTPNPRGRTVVWPDARRAHPPEDPLATKAAVRKPRAVTAPAPQALQVEEIVSMVGPKIAELRKAQGLSLQQLAVISDVSAAAIHKMERNGMVPTITTLLKLGTALGVPVSYFVQEEESHPEPVHFTAADERRAVFTPHTGLSLSGITGSYRQFQTAAAVASMAPGANSGEKPLKHPGEELVHVLRGQVRFHVGEQDFVLTEGDSLHFSGDVPHHWENASKKPAEVVWVALRNG